MKPWLGWIVGALCLTGVAGASEPSSRAPAAVPPERIQKLIEQLGDSEFKVREQASAELSRLGGLALPALTEAAANSKDPEVQVRAKALVEKIPARERPRAGLRTVLARMQQATPAPSDRQVAVAIYLLSVSRPATDAEIDAVEKRLKGAKNRAAEADELMWPLLCGREFNDKLAEVNLRVTELRQQGAGMPLVERLHLLNGPEFQKSLLDLSTRLSAALDKRSDEQVVDAAFLLFLGRLPRANETTVALAHIKQQANRQTALENVLWALSNTKEFIAAK
jgi:hypothetical protein